MLPMDIPYVPAQDTPVVLAQAATGSAMPPPEYILKACMETVIAVDSGLTLVEPDGMLATYIQKQINSYVDISAVKNVVLLKDAAHGKIVSNTAPSGRQYYAYVPPPKFRGNDKAVFMAEFKGNRFRIDVELHVLPVAGKKKPTTCPSPQLIKARKSALGSSGYNSKFILASSAAGYNGFSYTFSSMASATGLPPASMHE
ncbi:MAG: hypothetical protein OEV15_05290 [Gallionella sp.]|nr:hypothetical protein [Gallionella sp.]